MLRCSACVGEAKFRSSATGNSPFGTVAKNSKKGPDVTTIKELEDDERRLMSELKFVRVKLQAAREAAAGVTVGDIVTHKKYGEVRVTQVETWSGTMRPWVKGTPKKKDGEWSTQVRHLFAEWSKP